MWFIKGLNLLEKIPVDELDTISRDAETIAIEKNKYLKPRDDKKDKVWLIKSGSLRLIKRLELTKEIVLATLEQGEFFGFYSNKSERFLRLLYSNEGTLCYLLPVESVKSAIKKINQPIKMEINLNGKFLEFFPDVENMLGKSLYNRVLNVLIFLGKNSGIKKSGGVVIKSTGILELLSRASFLSNTVIIPLLAIMRKNGIIDLYPDRIVIKDETLLG